MLIFTLLLTFFSRVWMDCDKICQDKPCVRYANTLHRNMNPKVKPCDNFYEYSCGNYGNNYIPPDAQAFDSFNEVYRDLSAIWVKILESYDNQTYGMESTAINKMKNYYQSCINSEKNHTLETYTLQKHIRNLGYWTLGSSEHAEGFRNSDWDITSAVIQSLLFNHGSLFNVGVEHESRETSRNVMKIQQSSLTLESDSRYEGNSSRNEKLRETMINVIAHLAEELGATNRSDSLRKANQVYDFEVKLANIHVPPQELYDPDFTYNPTTLGPFTDRNTSLDLRNQINYTRVMQALTRNNSVSGKNRIIDTTPGYFLGLKTLLNTTEKEIIANYIVWSSFWSLRNRLSSVYESIFIPLQKELSGKKYPDRVYQRCLNTVKRFMGFALTSVYSQDHFTKKDNDLVSEIALYVKEESVLRMKNIEWLSEKTRKAAELKIESMIGKLGFPDWVTDAEMLDSHYETLQITSGNHVENVLQLSLHKAKVYFTRQGEPFDRNVWISTNPTSINAYYRPYQNSFVFPVAFFHYPHYLTVFSTELLFATFGVTVGHEMFHGLDSGAINFDDLGNYRKWFSNSSNEAFNEKKQCLIDQFSNFTIKGHPLNGNNTLDENLADNGALQVAYSAMLRYRADHPERTQKPLPGLSHITPDQMFFIAYAQFFCSSYAEEFLSELPYFWHPPGSIRVVGNLQNLKPFSEVYGCKLNSYMNPEQKCSIW